LASLQFQDDSEHCTGVLMLFHDQRAGLAKRDTTSCIRGRIHKIPSEKGSENSGCPSGSNCTRVENEWAIWSRLSEMMMAYLVATSLTCRREPGQKSVRYRNTRIGHHLSEGRRGKQWRFIRMA